METELIGLIIIGLLSTVIVGLISYIWYKPLDSFLGNIKWRRAVKHFSSGPVDLQPIEEAIVNAPSSFGLQPYKVIVVTDPEVKRSMRAVCYNQAQVEEGHAVFVFCVIKDVETRMEKYIEMTQAEPMRVMMKGFLDSCPDKMAWAKQQAYISLGFGLAAAAERRIPSCPMEGFVPDKLAELLHIDEGLVPCVLLAVGAEADDKLNPRFRFDDILIK
jgi:nitroreductase/dihydropteridine reductase